MIENLNFIERVFLLILYLVCIGALIRCAFGFWSVKKSLDVSINLLTDWVNLYESKKRDETR